MKYKIVGLVLFIILSIYSASCDFIRESIKETSTAYQIQKDTAMVVILQTPLGSNENQRGDQFVCSLKNPISFKGKFILPKGSEIRGLVKRVVKYEKFGDRAGLILLFDQIALPNGARIPMAASLDTDEGNKVFKIKGKGVKSATVVGSAAIIGALVGKEAIKEEGAQKGLIIGTAAGAGAVFLSNMKEVKLPVGTELIIKLEEPLIIPK